MVVVMHACSPSTQEAETERSPAQDQTGLHSKMLSQSKMKEMFYLQTLSMSPAYFSLRIQL
jgi:hypothetical protein